MMMSSKTHTMRSKTNGNYLFFDDNNGKIYYSLVSKSGKTLRKGEMSISANTFIDYMQKIGFEYVNAEEKM